MAFALLTSTLLVAVVLLAGVEGVVTRSVEMLRALLPISAGTPRASSAEAGVWPSMLATVTELQATTFQQLVPEFLGRVGCLVCFTGFAILLLPRRAPWWAHGGAALYGLVLTVSVDRAGLGRRFYAGAVIAPLVTALVWCLGRDDAAAR